MKSTVLFVLFLLSITAVSGATRKETRVLMLGETGVRVNVYENAGASVTFFAPHHNEQTAINLAKEAVGRRGGRVVEIESYDDNSNPSRYLKFSFKGKFYTLDPNRIYTENGIACAGFAGEAGAAVKQFADAVLQIVFAPDGKSLRAGERFVVAVHNNADVDGKDEAARTTDLTAVAFVKGGNPLMSFHGAFQEQADGVYLSNTEADADNFVFLSHAQYVGYFAGLGFNVVVQKPAAKLESKRCTIDDGSLSVRAAQSEIHYICLEADSATGAPRQRQMLEAVYALLAPAAIETNLNAGVKRAN